MTFFSWLLVSTALDDIRNMEGCGVSSLAAIISYFCGMLPISLVFFFGLGLIFVWFGLKKNNSFLIYFSSYLFSIVVGLSVMRLLASWYNLPGFYDR